MSKFHIGRDGTPKKCTAQIKCRLGGEHFDTKEQAEAYVKNEGVSEIMTELINNSSDKNVDGFRTERAMSALTVKDRVYKDDVSSVISDVSMPDGGGTYNPYSNETPQVGFCYSSYPERSVEFNSINDLTINTLNNYSDNNKDLLNKENHYIGLWHDPASGKIYLDVSINTLDAQEARKQCEENDQIAYFDLQDFSSVTVNPNATSGQG